MQYNDLLLPRGDTLKGICQLLAHENWADGGEDFTNGLDTFSALCVNAVIDGYNSLQKCSCSAPTRRLPALCLKCFNMPIRLVINVDSR